MKKIKVYKKQLMQIEIEFVRGILNDKNLSEDEIDNFIYGFKKEIMKKR